MTAEREAMTLEQVRDGIIRLIATVATDGSLCGYAQDEVARVFANLSRAAEPVIEICDDLGYPILTWMGGVDSDSFKVGDKFYARPPEPARDAVGEKIVASAMEVARAASGLCHGIDWNGGTHAKLYRASLIEAVFKFEAAMAQKGE